MQRILFTFVCLNILAGVLSGCGSLVNDKFGFVAAMNNSPNQVMVIPPDMYKSKYDQMFDAALTVGVQNGYKPTFQDRKNGLITLVKPLTLEGLDALSAELAYEKTTLDVMYINIIFGNYRDVTGGIGIELKATTSSTMPPNHFAITPIRQGILRLADVQETNSNR